jgi:hypothetical protein
MLIAIGFGHECSPYQEEYIGSYGFKRIRCYCFYRRNRWNSSYIRKLVCTDMEYFELLMDAKMKFDPKKFEKLMPLIHQQKFLVVPTMKK